jgi:heme oxygenase
MEESIHQLLKQGTRARHEQAEGHPFQGALAQGKLPLPSYRRYLIQLAHLHERFESRLREAAETSAPVKSVVADDYFQLPFLQADLKALNLSQRDESPAACLVEFDQLPIFSRNPESLIGVLYVLLGSKHGAKFIAHNVKTAYALGSGGWTYFDPYGDRFRPLWQTFTGSLNALPSSEELKSAVLNGADAAFEIFVDLGDEIWRGQPAALET